MAMMCAGCDQISLKEQGNAASQVPAVPATPTTQARQAEINVALAADNNEEAVTIARKAIEENPTVPEVHLLLARAEARSQNIGNAVTALRKSFELGFHDPRGALAHPDFDRIRSISEFQTLSRQFAASANNGKPEVTNVEKAADPKPKRVISERIQAGDVSISSRSDGSGRIRAGDVVIED